MIHCGTYIVRLLAHIGDSLVPKYRWLWWCPLFSSYHIGCFACDTLSATWASRETWWIRCLCFRSRTRSRSCWSVCSLPNRWCRLAICYHPSIDPDRAIAFDRAICYRISSRSGWYFARASIWLPLISTRKYPSIPSTWMSLLVDRPVIHGSA